MPGVRLQGTLAGSGIALLPTYRASQWIPPRPMVRVLPDDEPEPLGACAVYLLRQHPRKILRAMLDFLAEQLGHDVAPGIATSALSTRGRTGSKRRAQAVTQPARGSRPSEP